jgi:hypothetical protein
MLGEPKRGVLTAGMRRTYSARELIFVRGLALVLQHFGIEKEQLQKNQATNRIWVKQQTYRERVLPSADCCGCCVLSALLRAACRSDGTGGESIYGEKFAVSCSASLDSVHCAALCLV